MEEATGDPGQGHPTSGVGGGGGSHGSANPGEEKAEGTAYIPLFPQSPLIPATFRAWQPSLTALPAPPHRVGITPKEAILQPLRISPVQECPWGQLPRSITLQGLGGPPGAAV